jgi:hypothetical protein
LNHVKPTISDIAIVITKASACFFLLKTLIFFLSQQEKTGRAASLNG